jgi:hypothetical protein
MEDSPLAMRVLQFEALEDAAIIIGGLGNE